VERTTPCQVVLAMQFNSSSHSNGSRSNRNSLSGEASAIRLPSLLVLCVYRCPTRSLTFMKRMDSHELGVHEMDMISALLSLEFGNESRDGFTDSPFLVPGHKL
jgi:hypothetical protein